MTFPEIAVSLHTDVQFDEMTDGDHHIGSPPFGGLSIGMVSQFPLDYMHLVCLSVTQRLILLWMMGQSKNRL